jgi:hypothetical protein
MQKVVHSKKQRMLYQAFKIVNNVLEKPELIYTRCTRSHEISILPDKLKIKTIQ